MGEYSRDYQRIPGVSMIADTMTIEPPASTRDLTEPFYLAAME